MLTAGRILNNYKKKTSRFSLVIFQYKRACVYVIAYVSPFLNTNNNELLI